MLHLILGPIWYHSEASDVPYSQNLPRPISWFGLFLQQNDSSTLGLTLRLFIAYVISNAYQLVGFANLMGAFATHSYL